MVSIRTAAPALLLILAGCVSGPDHKPPEMPLPAKFSEGGAKLNGDVAKTAWWIAFNDRRLEGFVTTGLAQNIQIMQSIEATNSAQSNVTVAGAGSLPSLLVGASHTTSGQMGNLVPDRTQNTSGSDVQVSWLLDLFRPISPRQRSRWLRWMRHTHGRRHASSLPQGSRYQLCNARYFQARISIAQENLKSSRNA